MRFWASPRSLVATGGISVDFFSSGYLDISVHRVRFQWLCIHHWILLAEWVSPFGHCRIKACCQLPDTFRRLPRPSSPLTAKASTVCAYSLDHITPSRLRITQPVVANINDIQMFRGSMAPALASTTRLDIRLKRSLRPIFSKSRTPATMPESNQIFVCASYIQDGGSGRTRTTGLTLIRGAL